MHNNLLSQHLFPDADKTIADLEAQYPPRQIDKKAKVTRVAPSPTGFMHIGGIYASLISERVAHQSPDGIFMLRIEDTDKEREVEGAVDIIVSAMKNFGLSPDEGQVSLKTDEVSPQADEASPKAGEIGGYGPYKQSNRKDIYKICAKHLVETGYAYPCFCTPEELEQKSKTQEEAKIRPGYRGEWATCRNRSEEEIIKLLEEGRPFALRFKSKGNFDNKIKFTDQIKGDAELSQNDLDAVLLKSDKLPTYHFAHVVDDHFMRVSDVIRGDEWFSSVPLHLELWNAFNFPLPFFAHISPIEKMDDNTSRRKLSKRKDPEANVLYYNQKGYPKEAIIEYLLNLANSNFEDWRKANPKADYKEFPFDITRMGKSGALFDEVKLNDVSKDVISRMSAQEVYENATSWAKEYDEELYNLLTKDKEYSIKIFSIERGDKGQLSASGGGRKDISKWSDIKTEIGFFYDEIFATLKDSIASQLSEIDKEVIQKATQMLLETYNQADTSDQWFSKIKNIAKTLGYAEGVKEYKQNPSNYKGHVGDIAKIFRILLVARPTTPDLYQIMQVLGEEEIEKRMKV